MASWRSSSWSRRGIELCLMMGHSGERAHERRLWRRFAESGPGSQRDEACGAATAGSGQGFASRMRRTGSRAARSGSGRLVTVRRMMMSHLRKSGNKVTKVGTLVTLGLGDFEDPLRGPFRNPTK